MGEEAMRLETAVTPRPASSASVFLNRNFVLLFSGKIVSQLGDQVYAFALSWYILDLTRSSFQMAIFLVIDTLVIAAISPLGGLLADRLNRKGVLVWMDVIRGVVVLVAAFLLWQHLMQIWMLYVSAIILGCCGAIFSPAASAIVPNIVEESQLSAATSANHFTTNLCTMLGMLVSGLLYGWIGMFAIFILNGASYFFSGVMEASVEVSASSPASSDKGISVGRQLNRAVKDLTEGYRYVKGNVVVYDLLLMNAMFSIVALPVSLVYMPYFFNVILKATPFQLALPQAAIWIGMIAGSFAVSLFWRRCRLKDLILWGLLLLGVFTLAGVPWFFPQFRSHFNNAQISLVWTMTSAMCGLVVNFFTIPMYVIFQKYTADSYRGRFWGLENSLRTFAMSAGYFVAGFLAERVSLGFLFLSVALALFAVDAWAINQKAIKALRD
jgi:DHA3 family macrolide efflux protein-like MFS transporter